MNLTTGNNSIDSLVLSSWAAQPGTAVTLSYSFLATLPASAPAQDALGFAPMSAAQQQQAQAAMALWASVANIHFVQVASDGDIRLGTNDQTALDSSGYAYIPDPDSSSVSLFLNNRYAPNAIDTAGSYGPTVLLHELGHTLGLKHPGDYDTTGEPVPGPFLPAATDDQDYTVMSYNAPSSHKLNGHYATTPMLYDIQAMQYLYGANLQYHAGDDHYVFTSSTLDQCIWDAGGNDVFDFSGCTAATVINLHAGGFSQTAPGLFNVSIAYNVVIEQAIAGSGGSTIYANDAGDTITGGAGNDYIYEGAGNDHITGGGGSDTVAFKGSLANYQISAVGSTVTVHGDGTDVLTGIGTLSFLEGKISVNDLPTLAHALDTQAVATGEQLYVSLGSDFIQPGSHATPHFSATLAGGAALPDWLAFDAQTATFNGTPGAADAGVYTVQVNATGSTGATANDDFTLVVGGPGAFLTGTPGNDTLTPGAGNDVVEGGAGVDTAVYAGAMINYKITSTSVIGAQGVVSSSVTVVDKVGNGGIDTLQGVERLQFADTGLALDADGEAGQIYRIYEAMLKRAPDPGGLGFWLHQLDHGTGVLSVANDFITSAEFTYIYGKAVTDADFVTALYANVLHRAPDAGGDAYWLDALAHGATRASMLVGFSDSTENIAAYAAVIPDIQVYVPVIA